MKALQLRLDGKKSSGYLAGESRDEEGPAGGQEMPEKYRTKEGHLNFWAEEEKHGVRLFFICLSSSTIADWIT